MVRPMLTEKCVNSVPAESALARKKTHCRNVHLVIMYLYWSNIGVVSFLQIRLTLGWLSNLQGVPQALYEIYK
jgi:hypothetical protein